MKKIIFFLHFLLVACFVEAQIKTGSNPTTIGNGQLLELERNGQRGGFKLAEVALTNSTDLTTINIPTTAAGTIVWNTGTGGLNPAGVYVWNGSQWNHVNGAAANGVDIGYIVGWGSNATPPDFLIPLSGGTFNKSDYPDFMLQHAVMPSQFIASETATTFTLRNINNQRFLRGNITAGSTGGSNVKTIVQANLPNVSLTGTTQNTTATMQAAGNHSHTYWDRGIGSYGLAAAGGGNNVEDDGQNTRTTAEAGNHTHTINPHNHNFTTSSLNGDVAQTGLDVQNAFADVVWCLKVKPTATAAAITINTGGATAPFSNAITASGNSIISNVNGQAASITPSSGIIQNQLGFDASGALVTQFTNVPVIEMAQSNSITIPANFTPVVIPFNHTINNANGWFNTSNGRFTPQRSGYWRIEVTARIYSNSTAESYLAYHKNGELITQAGGFGAVMESISKIVYFNGTTDYLTASILGYTTRTEARTANLNHFSAYYVGP